MKSRNNKIRPNKKMRISKAIIYTSLAIAVFVFIAPLFFMLNTSVKGKKEFLKNRNGIVKVIQMDQYVKAFKAAKMQVLFFNSMLFTICIATLQTIVSALAAYPLSRKLVKGSNLFYMLITLGMFLPGGLIPLFILMRKMHLTYTYHGFIIMGAAGGLTIGIFILVGFIKNIPKSLDEAALVEGCGLFRFFFSILMPLLKPALAAVWIMKAIWVWNDFLGPFIYLKSKQRTLPTGLFFFKGQYFTDWPLLMAGATIITIPIIIIYSIVQRQMIDGVVAGAVKG